jgi:hypothetical protein
MLARPDPGPSLVNPAAVAASGEWGERHVVAELLEALNVVPLCSLGIALLEVFGSEFVVHRR